MSLSARHRRTLQRLFEEPTRADVDWDDFAGLVEALGGAWMKPGHTAGSRRRAKLKDVKGLFHHPHLGSIIKKGSVESAREFLRRADVTPEKEAEQ